jgi:hypothetical protein
MRFLRRAVSGSCVPTNQRRCHGVWLLWLRMDLFEEWKLDETAPAAKGKSLPQQVLPSLAHCFPTHSLFKRNYQYFPYDIWIG